jgi:hypothetical protein
MLIIHAVLDHDVSLAEVAQSRRVNAPSGTVVWRLPDRRELAVLMARLIRKDFAEWVKFTYG